MRFVNFIKYDVVDYDKVRDFLELDKISYLLCYLWMGEILIWMIW